MLFLMGVGRVACRRRAGRPRGEWPTGGECPMGRARRARLLRGEISSHAGGGAGTSRAGPVWTPRANFEKQSPFLRVSARSVLTGRMAWGRPTASRAEGGADPSCAGPVRTPRAASPPPSSCVRFQCVIKSHPWPEPSSPKTSLPRQSNMVGRKGHKERKNFAAFAFFVAKINISLPNRSIEEWTVKRRGSVERARSQQIATLSAELFRSEIAHPHTGGPRLPRPHSPQSQ